MITTFVAVDPSTGAHLRDATAAERDAYLAQPCRGPAFRRMVRMGNVLVDEYQGYGVNHSDMPLFNH